VDEHRIPPAGDPFSSKALPSKRSTRQFRCDHEFLELLEEDFGISQFTLRSAFMGSEATAAPKKQAIELCEWAIRTAKGDTDEAGRALRNWARKRSVGTFDPYLLMDRSCSSEGTAARLKWLHSLTREQHKARRESNLFWGAAFKNPSILDERSWPETNG
jgi:hypothetical protein